MIARLLPLLVAACTAVQAAWPPQLTRVEIPCNDGARQPAMWHAPAAEEKKPLLVGLHTWSSSYDTAGGDAIYAEWCLARGWAFLHPHFRGPNKRPLAMGSERAVKDIVEAVAWAKKQTPIDADRVYLVGVSGGGHMALLMAGRHPELWAGVSAWCGISDIGAWHAEHVTNGKPDEYARDIESALGHAPAADDADAWKRSPLSWLAAAAAVPLDINHGIHDGRAGSVRFTHSLRAFNAAVPESARLDAALFPIYYETRSLPAAGEDASYGRHRPLFRAVHGNTRLTIFEGGHEIVHQAALNWLARQRRGKPADFTNAGFLPLEDAATESGK